MKSFFRKSLNPIHNTKSEASQQIKSSLVAINYLSINIDLSSIIFSSGYTPSRLDILNKGFLLLYYTDPYTATMAAWFFEIQGIPAATISGWSLIRICGPITLDEVTEIISFKPFAITFFNYKVKYSWIAVHGIHTKQLLLKYIRNQNWNIVEALHNRNFQDVVEVLEIFNNEEVPNCYNKLEYMFVSLLEKKSYNIENPDQYRLHQKLVLLSRCSRLTNEIYLNGVYMRNTHESFQSPIKRDLLLAIRKYLYSIPIFTEACISKSSLKSLKTEEWCLGLDEKPIYRRENGCFNDCIETNNNYKAQSNHSVSRNKLLERMLRVILIELITHFRAKYNNSKYPNITEVSELWKIRFGIEVDIIQLFKMAGLYEEIKNIVEATKEIKITRD
ncbi:unnamed protein product [Cryptosporidium hominis]|uniref:Uncharacterized protein n=1 Tax=Cryptosporidium hominis TaxID=237895 RepID=A0A0S4TE66_CRYHO|nr:hypothetical protein [Cryptosporidium hominis TU502]OLQ17201.1 hypothetical protein ChTU502y2012_401g0430 [Cryptosporidium hominis]PPA65212.1 hypothetical protein ChUKH1_16000 [Cryptosporidium hominis]PPS93716.1 Uncharacterized protein GY17_00002473 [Cryptosporidium hominis]CUV05142.1 unnamed protein product [Cryptosporidium hominis]|eukprot:PPS93716.1 Uncharacterized protein GY17_00002473 [Cryptosporidium hominis]